MAKRALGRVARVLAGRFRGKPELWNPKDNLPSVGSWIGAGFGLAIGMFLAVAFLFAVVALISLL